MRRLSIQSLSHLALWPGLYVAAAVTFVLQIAGAAIPAKNLLHLLLLAFLTAVGVYLLDRVKLRDAWLDPADAAAHPDRYQFLAQRSGSVRVIAFASLAIAGVVGWLNRAPYHVLVAVPVIAAGGVLLYAARPRGTRPRPKDILIIKNAYIAGGITGFALLLALCVIDSSMLTQRATGGLILAGAALLCRVFADAALCDLDDLHADRRFGTRTLATTMGRMAAWNIAMWARIISAAALVAIPVGSLAARLAWAGATLASSVLLRLASPLRVRDWVDARFALEAVVVGAVLFVLAAR